MSEQTKQLWTDKHIEGCDAFCTLNKRSISDALVMMRGDYEQALAAAQERIKVLTDERDLYKGQAGLLEDNGRMAAWRMVNAEDEVKALRTQLAQQDEWMPVPDGIYQGFEVNADGNEIITTTNDVHGIEWDANIILPDNVRLCRRKEQTLDSAGAEE